MNLTKKWIRKIVRSSKFKALLNRLGSPGRLDHKADAKTLGKGSDFVERYREIISDPLNLAIARVPNAGYLDHDDCVILHNGIAVPVSGDLAYYQEFSDILLINRGVHEPLEEFCFQQLLKKTPKAEGEIVMIELGAYWGHYSMWMKQRNPAARVILVEPDKHNIKVGRNNFRLNKMQGEFINEFVAADKFTVDGFVEKAGLAQIHVLHSDIQGFELDMLQNCRKALSDKRIDHVFVSTHSRDLHMGCLDELQKHGYGVEVSSEPDAHSTSFDGFILATSPNVEKIFGAFSPMGRVEIAKASVQELMTYLKDVERVMNA